MKDYAVIKAFDMLPKLVEKIDPIDFDNENIIKIIDTLTWDTDTYINGNKVNRVIYNIKYIYNGEEHTLACSYNKNNEGDVIEYIMKMDLFPITQLHFIPTLSIFKDLDVGEGPYFKDIISDEEMEGAVNGDFEECFNEIKDNLIKLFETFNEQLEGVVKKYTDDETIVKDSDLLLVFGTPEDLNDFKVMPTFIKLPNIVNRDETNNGVLELQYDSPYKVDIDNDYTTKIKNICNDLSRALRNKYVKNTRNKKGFIKKYYDGLFYNLVCVPLYQKIVYCYTLNNKDVIKDLEEQTNKLIDYLKSLGEGYYLDPHAEVIYTINEDRTAHVRHKEHEEFIRELFKNFTNNFGNAFISYLETVPSDYFGSYVIGVSKKETKEINPNEVIMPEIL